MSIANYSELQSEVLAYLMRTGDTFLSARIPTFIKLAEKRINYGAGNPDDPTDPTPFKSHALRVRQMQTRATLTISGEYVGVPDDFLEVISIKDNSSPEVPIGFVSPHQFAESAISTGAGAPRVYTIIGDEFRFGPSGSTQLELWYYASVPALSDDEPTNWLMTLKPDIYLFGSLVESSSFIGDDERLPHWFSLYSGALRGLMGQDKRAKYGGTPLIMRPLGPTP
jgi:hypothetical protein